MERAGGQDLGFPGEVGAQQVQCREGGHQLHGGGRVECALRIQAEQGAAFPQRQHHDGGRRGRDGGRLQGGGDFRRNALLSQYCRGRLKRAQAQQCGPAMDQRLSQGPA